MKGFIARNTYRAIDGGVIIVGVALLLMLGGFSATPVTADSDEKCPSQLTFGVAPIGYDHTRFSPAAKSSDRLFSAQSFVAAVDGLDDDNNDGENEYTITPSWVSAEIRGHSASSGYASGIDRPSKWYRNDIFDVERDYFSERNRVDDSYRGVGNTWNRGHMISRTASNRVNAMAGCESHVFANAVPQAAKFNQGIWLALENRELAMANYFGAAWVTSGTLFEGDLETIGDSDELPVAIPSHLYKVIVIDTNQGVVAYSFIFPNVATVSDGSYKSGRCASDKSYDIEQYQVSLTEIERRSGYRFAVHDSTRSRDLLEMPVDYLDKVGSCF
ncbi:DNA/RNA non-specific endonuclease [uncultured Umboniibacter sp.]|uniref:DNA/RNA non-specific endonuclease n=1 Tax=uncultured Umboniibacter sp. TaxID=1798917 RepID=UPI00261AE3F2|nr:DNA/RNA non-specific endonuclease [uncultured Umboniibacter sp.]